MTNGTSAWIPLRDVKESDPIKVVEYAISHKIDHHSALTWWVPHTLKKRTKIIKAVSRRMKRNKIKFGITVPSTPAEAKRLDEDNNNFL